MGKHDKKKSRKKKNKQPLSVQVWTIQSDGTLIIGPLAPGSWEFRKL